MKPIQIAVLVSFLTGLSVLAAGPTAEQLLGKAETQAATEHKAIFIHFGASWCGWCKRLDAFLEQPEVKPIFEKYFVPVKLVVQENADNKSLETAGANVWLDKLSGRDQGLPYSAFLDPTGSLVVSSTSPSGNIGYPGEPAEIDWFLGMMKKAKPDMAEGDLKAIESVLRSFKP